MLRIGIGGVIVGLAVAAIAMENSTPGTTAPAMENTRTAGSNLMVTLGGMVSDAVHVAVPVAADAVNVAREEFPNVLGPAPDPNAAGGGTAQHPPAQPQP